MRFDQKEHLNKAVHVDRLTFPHLQEAHPMSELTLAEGNMKEKTSC